MGAFAAMGGLTFLLGCASEPTQIIPTTIKSHCLGVLATLCQNNPSVQYNLLELGAMKTLVTLYNNSSSSQSIQIQTKVVQTLSCMIRNHAMAEHIFCQDEMSIQVLESGLGLSTDTTTTTSALQKRCLFFLQALVTSDTADKKRLQTFTPCLNFIITKFLTCDNVELREMTLSMVLRLFQQDAQILTHHTNLLQTIGTQRISTIQSLTGEELDFAQEELYHWQTLQSLL